MRLERYASNCGVLEHFVGDLGNVSDLRNVVLAAGEGQVKLRLGALFRNSRGQVLERGLNHVSQRRRIRGALSQQIRNRELLELQRDNAGEELRGDKLTTLTRTTTEGRDDALIDGVRGLDLNSHALRLAVEHRLVARGLHNGAAEAAGLGTVGALSLNLGGRLATNRQALRLLVKGDGVRVRLQIGLVRIQTGLLLSVGQGIILDDFLGLGAELRHSALSFDNCRHDSLLSKIG